MGTHSGIFQQYTISNATKFYYDDIYIGDEIIDSIPPIVLSAEAHSLSTIDLLFNEGVDQVSAENVSNYNVSPFLSINNAVLDTVNPALVHLSTAQPMTNGQTYQVSIASISDLALNGAGTQSTQLTCMFQKSHFQKMLLSMKFFSIQLLVEVIGLRCTTILINILICMGGA